MRVLHLGVLDPVRRGTTAGEKGFTLLEMTLVLGLVLTVGTLSHMWYVAQVPKWRLNGAVRQVVSDLMEAKMHAVTRGRRQRVTFLDAHRYTLLDDRNNNGRSDAGESLVERDIRLDFGDVRMDSTNHPVFHPRGTASNLATVRLSNSAGTKVVTIGITGRVTVRTLS